MISKEQIERLIIRLERDLQEAESNFEKWDGTNVTYGDSDRSASDVEFGRAEAFEEVIKDLRQFLS